MERGIYFPVFQLYAKNELMFKTFSYENVLWPWNGIVTSRCSKFGGHFESKEGIFEKYVSDKSFSVFPVDSKFAIKVNKYKYIFLSSPYL